MEDEFARILIAYLGLVMQAICNTLDLFTSPTVNASNIWGLLYALNVLNYNAGHVASNFLQTTKNSSTALSNLSQAVSYLGSNASTVFGNLEGSKGFARIQRNAVEVLLADRLKVEILANDFSRMLKSFAQFAVKMLQSVEDAFL